MQIAFRNGNRVLVMEFAFLWWPLCATILCSWKWIRFFKKKKTKIL